MLPFLTAQANNLLDLACLIFLGYICANVPRSVKLTCHQFD